MLLLASASARRTDLLDLINIKHKVVEQDFDESSIVESDPIECSKLIVKGKNQSARTLLNDNDLEKINKLIIETVENKTSAKIRS